MKVYALSLTRDKSIFFYVYIIDTEFPTIFYLYLETFNKIFDSATDMS